MDVEIIGHGTWLDKIAQELLDRERKLEREDEIIRTESGLGASGFPHIGSFSDCARSYGLKLALEEIGTKSEYISFSDDKDGLRKVPAGLPDSLKKYLGFPVTSIPDPFNCHDSYGDHMSSLLIDAMDRTGIEYKFYSATKAYKTGLFNEQIKTILINADRIGKIIMDELGQEKYVEILPYFPVCENCGRIYTTSAYEFLPDENKILYSCEGMKVHNQWLKGCDHKSELDYRQGDGKLSWKGEFAARWSALKINFEAYGKDIADSVKVNDRISKEILKYAPPMHVRYEMFLDKGGKKISKSKGNVFTPQVWLDYGSPQSLLLLMFKRIVGTRAISYLDIPKYMDEIDGLEEIFFKKKKIKDKKEFAKLKGLYLYSWLLKPPKQLGIHIPYNLLIYLARVAPEKERKKFVIDKLIAYGYFTDSVDKELEKKIDYAINWAKDFGKTEEVKVSLKNVEKDAISDLIDLMEVEDDEEKIQSSIFAIARKNDLSARDFFRTLYMLLLGTQAGPKLGSYIKAMGKESVIISLKKALKKSS